MPSCHNRLIALCASTAHASFPIFVFHSSFIFVCVNLQSDADKSHGFYFAEISSSNKQKLESIIQN